MGSNERGRELRRPLLAYIPDSTNLSSNLGSGQSFDGCDFQRGHCYSHYRMAIATSSRSFWNDPRGRASDLKLPAVKVAPRRLEENPYHSGWRPPRWGRFNIPELS
jgi:hypothetical protein